MIPDRSERTPRTDGFDESPGAPPPSGRSGLRHFRRSVRGRLMVIVLATTTIALLAAGIAMLSYDLTMYRDSWASDLQSEAGILALSTAPALAFDDQATAQRNLDALQVLPRVLSAAIYNNRGELYASYVRPGVRAPSQKLNSLETQTHVSGELIELSHPIVQHGERLGVIYLRARYGLWKRLGAYLQIFALVTLVSLLVAVAFSVGLQKVITGPLEAMASVARGVVTARDYSLRAKGASDDEIGLVLRAFNSMLDEVQSRNDALERSNAALQQEVSVRQRAEAALSQANAQLESAIKAVRESEKLYRAIGESIDYGVWVCDASGRNVYASESFLHLIGMTQEQCAGVGWSELLHPDDLRTTLAAWQECVRAGGNWYREHRFRGRDGRYHPILAQGVPIRDDQGRASGWAGINLDISRLKQTEEALRTADRRKDEFLAILAHELRNPLAPIRHAVALLGAPAASERQRQWGREVIGRQVHRMALLLDDLLDVSRITRGRLDLKRDYVALKTLIGAAVETVRPLIETKRHTLSVELPAEPLELQADPLRLSQALSNLLTNSAKYTDEGGLINLRVTLAPEALIATVQDNGIGLEANAIPRLFEMFSQVDSAIDRAQGGLGIGLALVKGLVELHGGSVSAESAGLGHGSLFTIRLPRDIVVSKPEILEEAQRPSQVSELPYCKVLVSDDNCDAADSLGMLLQVYGHRVWIAHSGAEALAIGPQALPNVVILDIGMPDMSGYEVARRIRQQAWGRRVLLIAVTGWGQDADKAQARAAGFDEHFTKPVSADAIQQRLARFLELQREEGARASTTPMGTRS